jgi:hypothetical protein
MIDAVERASAAAQLASTEALAIAAAALLAGGTEALARLAPALGGPATAVIDAWRALARVDRARAVASAVAAVRLPRPMGAGLIHPDWIEAALATEPPIVRAALDGDDPPVQVWLARHVFAGLVRMPRAVAADRGLSPATVAGAPASWLEAALIRAGRYQLAWAVVGAPRAGHLALAARLGAHGPAVLATIAELAGSADAAARWGSQRAAIARVAGVALEDPDALLAIGARAFGPHLGGDGPRQLMQRLPRARGLRIAADLGHPQAERVPWDALVHGIGAPRVVA